MKTVPRSLALALASALLTACTKGPATGLNRREFDGFSISVPAAWTQVVYRGDEGHKGKYGWGGPGVYFEGPAGEYLDVVRDVGTDFFDADMWWKGQVTMDGGLIVEGKEGLCEAGPPEPLPEGVVLGPPACLAGDGRLDALMTFDAKGHGYIITFGNVNRERAEDLKPFKAILATFKAK
jgi:hypothetical protein